MQVKTTLHAILVVLVLPAALAAQKRGLEYDRDADFSSYEKYDWIEQKKRPPGSPLAVGGALDTKIRNAIDAQLASQGFGQAMDGKPDFLVSFDGAMEQVTNIESSRFHVAPHVSWVAEGDSSSYRKGTLIISISDAASGKRVWSAWTQEKVKNPNKNDQQINRAVRKLLSKFPPQK